MTHKILQLKNVHETKDTGYSHVAKVGKTLSIAGQVARDAFLLTFTFSAFAFRIGLYFLFKFIDGEDPSETAANVLQTKPMKVLPVHRSNAVGNNNCFITEVKRFKGPTLDASVSVDTHQYDRIYLQHDS